MKQITLNIDESKYQFFLELISSFDFIEITDNGDSKNEIVTNIKQGLVELKLYQAGKLNFRDANELIDEL
jgi:hypothetical protein